ncbi:unnamed protein product [Rhizophagus irregularis]|nr:unnamed protein product [Rhizophagus irregularis]CAB5380257.1 unnamed protein product [Rhizophagus irregularis]
MSWSESRKSALFLGIYGLPFCLGLLSFDLAQYKFGEDMMPKETSKIADQDFNDTSHILANTWKLMMITRKTNLI